MAVSLTGTQLTGRATVTFTVPAGWTADQIPVVVWQDGHGGWRWLPTSAWTPGTASVSAQTDHFSSGALAAFDVKAATANLRSTVSGFLTGRTNVSAPMCQLEQQTRQQISVTNPDGDTIKWCLGTEGGRTLLKIANNRRIYTQVAYPKSWPVVAGLGDGLSVDGFLKATGRNIEGLAYTKRNMLVQLIEPGKTLILAVPAGAQGTVEVKASVASYYLQIIRAGVDEFSAVGGFAGLKFSNPTLQRFVNAVRGSAETQAWRAATVDCLKSFTDDITGRFTDSITSDQIAGIGKFALTCGSSLGKASVADSGPVLWFTSALISAVLTVVDTVVTLTTLLLSGVREIWDSFATIGGRSNPIYILTLTSRAAAPTLGIYAPTPGAMKSSNGRAPLRLTLPAGSPPPAALGIRYEGHVWPVPLTSGQDGVYDVYITGLTNGHTYSFIAEACAAGGLCSTSPAVTFTPYGLPTVGALTLTAAGTRLTLRWAGVDMRFNPMTGIHCTLTVTAAPADPSVPTPQLVGLTAGSTTFTGRAGTTYTAQKYCTNSFFTDVATSKSVTP